MGLAIEVWGVRLAAQDTALSRRRSGVQIPYALPTTNALRSSIHANTGYTWIDGWEIGLMMAPDEGLISIGREGEVELPQFSRDELARYFSRQPLPPTKTRR